MLRRRVAVPDVHYNASLNCDKFAVGNVVNRRVAIYDAISKHVRVDVPVDDGIFERIDIREQQQHFVWKPILVTHELIIGNIHANCVAHTNAYDNSDTKCDDISYTNAEWDTVAYTIPHSYAKCDAVTYAIELTNANTHTYVEHHAVAYTVKLGNPVLHEDTQHHSIADVVQLSY